MICSKCGKNKPPGKFHLDKRKARGRQPWCKECRKAIDKDYNRARWKSGVKKAEQARRRQRNREFIWEFLSKNPCKDCGESDPIVLQFNHLRDKKYNVSEMTGRTSSLEKIQEEIDKCEVLCANCHVRRTAVQLNWHIVRSGL